jgi:hypothetical protein
MDVGPKVGPLVAELLSGFTALLLAYFDCFGPALKPLHDLPGTTIFFFILLAWIVGTFFDLIRNLLEWVWDCGWFVEDELNWKFLIHGDESKVARLEHYYSLVLHARCGPSNRNRHLHAIWSLDTVRGD